MLQTLSSITGVYVHVNEVKGNLPVEMWEIFKFFRTVFFRSKKFIFVTFDIYHETQK